MSNDKAGKIDSRGLISMPIIKSSRMPTAYIGLFDASVDLSGLHPLRVGSIVWRDEERHKTLLTLISNRSVCIAVQLEEGKYFRSERGSLEDREDRLTYNDDYDDGYSLSSTEMWDPEIARKAVLQYMDSETLHDEITWKELDDLEPPSE